MTRDVPHPAPQTPPPSGRQRRSRHWSYLHRTSSAGSCDEIPRSQPTPTPPLDSYYPPMEDPFSIPITRSRPPDPDFSPLSPLRPRYSAFYRTSEPTAELSMAFSPSPGSISEAESLRSSSPEAAAGEATVASGGRDALLRRLQDLVCQVSDIGRDMRDDNVDTLHAQVDEMTSVLDRSSRSTSRDGGRNRSSFDSHCGGYESDLRHESTRASTPGSPKLYPMAMPVFQGSLRASSGVTRGTQTEPGPEARMSTHQSRKSTEQVEKVLDEAQELQKNLVGVICRLKARQEEQEHLHELLIMRAERAARRVIQLEGRAEELESERDEGEMDILNLQIQLKAIEAQLGLETTKNTDPDLLSSIERWKSDWGALKRKRARMKDDELSLATSMCTGGSGGRSPLRASRHGHGTPTVLRKKKGATN